MPETAPSVTAPTCGSCGVLPAVLMYMQQKYDLPDRKIAEALGVAGLFGNLVRHNASDLRARNAAARPRSARPAHGRGGHG